MHVDLMKLTSFCDDEAKDRVSSIDEHGTLCTILLLATQGCAV